MLCRILEKTTWNFRMGLESFMELIKENQIPSEAFSSKIK